MTVLRCAHCSKKGKVELKYYGKSLCRACFLDLTRRRIAKNMRLNKLVQRGDKLAVAISGGKDSITMLHFLQSYCKERRIPLLAIYVDRGDLYSKKSAEVCKKNCKELKIPFHVFSFKKQWDLSMLDISRITQKVGANKCAVCGVFRRRLLDMKARELDCNKIAIGHNLTDEAQTYLMNFSKGELDLFSALGPKSSPARQGFVQRIKPLRTVPADEVRLYADLKGYDYIKEPCPCRDGSLRFNFMGHLEDIKKTRAGAEFAIVGIGDEIANLVRSQSKGKPRKCKNCGALCANEVCRVCQYLKLKNEKER